MKNITIPIIQEMKNKSKITMITAYDAQMGKLVDSSGIEIILVGDSLGTVVMGYPDPMRVTMQDMLHHVRAVSSGVKRSLIVADLPFGSMQMGGETLRRDSIELIRAGAHAVKIEGAHRCEEIRDLVNSGIPVMGHLGLTPQSIHAFGGFKIQARGKQKREAIIKAAQEIEAAGVFAIVLECIPSTAAQMITQTVSIPTIGIGAGKETDGQVLVVNDLLNLDPDFKPKFVRQYADLSKIIRGALTEYSNDVKNGSFPSKEHEYGDLKE